MKKIILILSTVLPLISFAASEDKICKQLEEKAWDNCREYMCTDSLESVGEAVTADSLSECLNSGDGDLNEGAQICVTEGELDSLIEEYNAKNVNKTVTCEQE